MRDILEDLFANQPLDPVEAARRNMRPQLRKRFYQHATVGEFDGRAKYRRAADGRADDVLWQEKLREERLREAGFEVVRFTWQQVTQEPKQTADRVREAEKDSPTGPQLRPIAETAVPSVNRSACGSG